MFINTFLYDNVDDYDFLKLKDVLGNWIFTWAKCFFNHLIKIKWSFDVFTMEDCCQIRDFKKPLLNCWCTFTQMYNYISISFSRFLWFLLILKSKSCICDL
jgi:hypothetical protein